MNSAIVWLHDSNAFPETAVVNPSTLPWSTESKLFELLPRGPADDGSGSGSAAKQPSRSRLFITPSKLSTELAQKNPKLQLSLQSYIAQAFGIPSRSNVTVVPKDSPDDAELDYVVLYFRDQYISRSDMWRLSCSLCDTCVYPGQRILFIGSLRADVGSIWRQGHRVLSGYVTARTRAIFRSESARVVIYIQMSKEMWDFEEDGILLYNKAIDLFLPSLFKRWRDMGAHHVMSVVLFSRVRYSSSQAAVCYRDTTDEFNSAIAEDEEETVTYRDFYRVVLDNVSSRDWRETLLRLKRQLARFKRDVLTENAGNGQVVISGEMTSAREGNVLEAINLAACHFQSDHIDRDLLRTGTSMIFVTPGTGIYDVDENLTRLTSEALMHNNMGIDFVCLSREPLHAVPLFRYRNKNKAARTHIMSSGSVDGPIARRQSTGNLGGSFSPSNSSMNSYMSLLRQQALNKQWEYAIPYYVDINYLPKAESSKYLDDLRKGANTTCKMYELQMMGFMENEISEISIATLRRPEKLSLDDWFDEYDEQVFKDVKSAEPEAREAESYRGRLSSDAVDAGSPMSDKSDSLRRRRQSHRGDMPSGSALPRNLLANKESSYSLSSGSKSSKKPNLVMGFMVSPVKPVLSLTKSDGSSVSAGNGSKSFGDKPADSKSNIKTVLDHDKDDASMSQEYQESAKIMFSKPSYHELPSQSDKADIMQSGLRVNGPKKSFGRDIPKKGANRDTQAWVVKENPSSALAKAVAEDRHLRKWKHAFTVPRASINFNWESMCAPASLPITTEYLPSAEALENEYSEYSYTLTVEPDELTISPEELMLELVGQRLNQGFQIVVAPREGYENNASASRAIALPKDSSGNFVTGALSGIDDRAVLSLSDAELHVITLNRDAKNIEVKRFVTKNKQSNPLAYEFDIWQLKRRGYHHSSIIFRPFNVFQQSWNYVDHCVAGYETKMTTSVRCWRTRFVLIPSSVKNPSAYQYHVTSQIRDELSDEELKLIGIQRFCAMVGRQRYIFGRDSGDLSSKSDTDPLDVVFTTLKVSQYATQKAALNSQPRDFSEMSQNATAVGLDYKSLVAYDKLKDDASIMAVIQNLLGPNGVLLEDRQWHSIVYENCFIGSDMVTWIVSNVPDVKTREEAILYGNFLYEKGVFDHVDRRHKLLDGFFFYCFRVSNRKQAAGRAWFKRGSNVKPLQSLGKSASQGMGSRISLSQTVFVDVDQQKHSYRPEFFTLHYDTVYNPEQCYHLRLEWINVTARLIDDTLRGWSRTLDRFGLRLVEVPLYETTSIHEYQPFRDSLPIKLKLSPPMVPTQLLSYNVPDQWWQHQILKKWDYVLDTEADYNFPPEASIRTTRDNITYRYDQYIHRSGVNTVQVDSEGVFQLLSNRLHTSRVFGPNGDKGRGGMAQRQRNSDRMPDPDALRDEFWNFCNDENQLAQFYEETVQHLYNEVKNQHLDIRRGSGDDSSTPTSPMSVANSSVSATTSLLAGVRAHRSSSIGNMSPSLRGQQIDTHGQTVKASPTPMLASLRESEPHGDVDDWKL